MLISIIVTKREFSKKEVSIHRRERGLKSKMGNSLEVGMVDRLVEWASIGLGRKNAEKVLV